MTNTAVALRGMQEAILNRMDSRERLSDAGMRYRSMSLVQLCREFLNNMGEQGHRGMDRAGVVGAALNYRSGLHGTTDFSNMLANVASKRLGTYYTESPGSYRVWARRGPDLRDFKPTSVVQLSAMPDLLRVNEAGEIKHGSIADSGETYSLLSYGRIIGFTRQAIVNDDLRGFDTALGGFAAAARRLENRLAYQQLLGNPVMSDGQQLFHSSRANVASGPSSALSFAALSAGRSQMRLQRGLQSEELNIAPAYLIVPVALEQTAYQLTSSAYTPARTADINEFRAGGRTALEPVVEPIIDSVGSGQWFLAADSKRADTVEYAYLEGSDVPRVEMKVGFDYDGVHIRCAHDFAAKAIDYRGLFWSQGS